MSQFCPTPWFVALRLGYQTSSVPYRWDSQRESEAAWRRLREEVRVEREPITDENLDQAMSGADISEEEHEVVLHAQEPVVEKRVVLKERVCLDTQTVQDEREISEEIRKEQIEVDDTARR